MKPSWNDAPEWAGWLAMDENGDWWWYEFEPYLGYDGFFAERGGCEPQEDVIDHSGWRSTAERRP